MTFTLLIVAAGVLFIVMAIGGSVLQRLPLTTSLVYLAAGMLLGPWGFGLIEIDLFDDAHILERLTEIAVIVSLFTAGLKLRVDWRDSLWHIPVRLAVISMVITIGLIAVLGTVGLGLSIGGALLLGAILAPTDPVLASDVQVSDPLDRDRVRFSLTGEAGLNDGTAFPFVMLGLGLLGAHELGGLGWRWAGVDLVWATVGGLGVGLVLGTAIGHLVLLLRHRHQEATGLDDFLALGLIALAYGVALLLHTYGFLAVFAAGLALSRIERRATGDDAEAMANRLVQDGEDAAVHPETAPAYMNQALLGFNQQLERIGEVALVVVVGVLLSSTSFTGSAIWFVPLLLLVVRPISVATGVAGTGLIPAQRRLIGWFGIRGIGSLYYLTYAITHGLEEPLARQIASLTLATIAVSVVVHGISVTPLMSWYGNNAVRLHRRAEGEQVAAVSGQ